MGNDEEGKNRCVLNYFNGFLIDCVDCFDGVVIDFVGCYNGVETDCVGWIGGKDYWVAD